MLERSAVRWLLGLVVALAIVGLLAYARGTPGSFGRAVDPPTSSR